MNRKKKIFFVIKSSQERWNYNVDFSTDFKKSTLEGGFEFFYPDPQLD